jgi:hypothetical protein
MHAQQVDDVLPSSTASEQDFAGVGAQVLQRDLACRQAGSDPR